MKFWKSNEYSRIISFLWDIIFNRFWKKLKYFELFLVKKSITFCFQNVHLRIIFYWYDIKVGVTAAFEKISKLTKFWQYDFFLKNYINKKFLFWNMFVKIICATNNNMDYLNLSWQKLNAASESYSKHYILTVWLKKLPMNYCVEYNLVLNTIKQKK